MSRYTSLAISNPEDLIFGVSPKKVHCGNGLIIGNGLVLPEINFTLPTILINEANWKTVLDHYTSICESVIHRARTLEVPGLVIEFEQLPVMTMHPEWGAEITMLIKKQLDDFFKASGIPNALRVTVVDLRDADKPPLLRRGESWEHTRNAFELSAQAGADILSIESVGGKEVHDQALLYADLSGIVASLGVLAYRDVAWLWEEITEIAERHGVVAGGDTACGFSNTAMQLAGQGMLPSSLAALDRAASAPRSLAAFEHGAVGPSKDCAYEGPIIKAITGVPISMEGRSSCCAHFSPLGNIAGAMADLWSNESVQNIQLLSGSAPEAFMELLAYDCRLFNTASQSNPIALRDMLVKSDLEYSPEALMLEPETVIKIAGAIIGQTDGYLQTKAAIEVAYESIITAHEQKTLKIKDADLGWLQSVPQALESLPKNESEALEYLIKGYGQYFIPEAYGF